MKRRANETLRLLNALTMKIPQCLMILISPIVLLNTCAEPESKFALKVDFLLDSPVFKESYLSNIYHESDSLNYETKKYHPGDTIIRESRAKITETNYPDINHEEVYDYQAIDAYISNDTIHLILRETYGDLYIDIFNGKYSINEWNSGANIESNGKRKQPDNSLIHFKRSKLIFKTKSFNEGDRILDLSMLKRKNSTEQEKPI
jgi:hypothetical protein